MYPVRAKIHDFAKGIVDDIENRVIQRVRELKARNNSVCYLEVEGILESTWKNGWETDSGKMLWNGLLSDDNKNIILQAKDEIFNEAQAYFTVESPIFSKNTEEKSTWVTNAVKKDRRYWSLLKQRLEEKMPLSVVDSIDRDSERILERLHDPKDKSDWRVTGLVVGEVQSGKTTNYSSLICKAADAGYRMIIVFSGILNDLRAQTQARLDEDFIGSHQFRNKEEDIDRVEGFCGVGLLKDFDPIFAPNSGTWMDKDFEPQASKAETLPWLFVIKKNTTVFDKLIGWMKSKVINKRNWPLLVIDDEADQASVNTRNSEDIVTATNSCIRSLLELFPRAAFVGYTATPFANIFISSTAESRTLGKDIFPRDFIVRIKPAPNYFGAKDFFGNLEEDGLDLFIPFDQRHSSEWIIKNGKHSSISDNAPSEVLDCIRYFIFATAIRIWRAGYRINDEKDYSSPVLSSSMLIHVSQLIRHQKIIANQCAELIQELRDEVSYDSDAIENETYIYKEILEKQRRTTRRIAESRKFKDLDLNRALPDKIEEISDIIINTLFDLELVVLNGEVKRETVVAPERREERLHAQACIYIGGNKLSRGLTLPGLCVSMFVRNTCMYDTLLQMGRWFGYRDGYLDLCRICTTPQIISKFQEIVEACEDLNGQLDQMNGKSRTPENYCLKILQHPGLLITARNKMRTARDAVVSFNGRTLEQRVLDIDQGLIQDNVYVASNLLDQTKRKGTLVYASDRYNKNVSSDESLWTTSGNGSKASGRIWKNIPAQVILEFLSNYSGQKGGASVEQQGMLDYICKMNEKGELTKWTVFVPGEERKGLFDVNYPIRKMIGESETSEQVALKTLKTGGHEYVGVSNDVMESEEVKEISEEAHRGEKFKRVRSVAGRLHPEEGYFILYLLQSKNMQNNEALKSKDNELLPIVSYYLWVPASRNPCSATMAQFNATVHDVEDFDEDETDENEE